MKKTFYILFAILISTLNFAVSQNCIPDENITAPGVYPDPNVGLPPAVQGVYYETVISTLIPTDTTYMGFTATVESIGIIKIIGLPNDLSWVSDSPNNYWSGGSKGCIKISGTPTQEGSYNLGIVLDMHGKVGGMPLSMMDTVKAYTIVVGPSGIEKMQNSFSIIETYPNPASNYLNIDIQSYTPSNVSIKIYNNIGYLIQENNFDIASGKNTITVELKNKLSNGIYFVKINSDTKSFTKKLLIQN